MSNKRAIAYPPQEQYDNWQDHAENLDMSVSQFITGMVEAGRKKFDAQITPDESVSELRDQRNDLKDELARTRERVEKLESQLHAGERGSMINHIRANPGCTFAEVQQEVAEKSGERLMRYVEALSGEKIERRDGKLYPVEGGE
ncbi:hypothetical protein [Halobellus rubicundus]|uniref:Uncharacterized protein n=1 Tax=Halobellus rubicundus TaxID=2996466 RepID=A0ABD5MFM9_9EURY